MAEIPGTLDTQRWITDQCRTTWGDEGAARQAVESAQRSIAALLMLWPKGQGVRVHVAVTVEMPADSEAQP